MIPDLSLHQEELFRTIVNADRHHAFNLLFTDMVEHILSIADNPKQASEFMAEKLRNLVGAKTVLVMTHHDRENHNFHELVAVFPERRHLLRQHENIHRILELSHDYHNARFFAYNSENPESRLLAEIGSGDSLIIPLQFGTVRVGDILFLDLMDRANLDSILTTLERLSSILALVLKNAQLYSHLEATVRERTIQLEQSLRDKDVLFMKAATNNEEAQRAITESQERIYAISLIHEEMYRTGNLSSLNMVDYTPRIMDRVLNSIAPMLKPATALNHSHST